MKRLAIIRPEPGCSATLERALAQGLHAFAIPLFEIAPLDWEAPDAGSFDGLLLTSANALRNGGPALDSLRGLAVYAVGEATADAARAAGFTVAATGNQGVQHLLRSVDPALHLLHLCGRDRVEVNAQAPAITELVVYESRELEGVDPAALDGCVVMVHSPRAAQVLAELGRDRSSISIAAISAAAADAAGPGWAAVETADAPTDDALLALAARLCEKGRGQ